MNDYLFLMHDDTPPGAGPRDEEWGAYLTKLGQAGALQGGSAMGGGVCVSKAGDSSGITSHISGYIRVQAESLDAARGLVVGNPVYEAGGTVEIRELPTT